MEVKEVRKHQTVTHKVKLIKIGGGVAKCCFDRCKEQAEVTDVNSKLPLNDCSYCGHHASQLSNYITEQVNK